MNPRVSPTRKAAYRHQGYQSELLELRHRPTQELHPSFHFYLFAKFGPSREFFFEFYSLDTAGVCEWELRCGHLTSLSARQERHKVSQTRSSQKEKDDGSIGKCL